VRRLVVACEGSTATLDRVVLGRISWLAACATALVTNAVSNVIPAAGGAVGVGLDYRMWEAAGVDADDAARATAAATMFSLTTLFALPTLTLASLLAGVRIPDTLIWVAVSGAVAFAALFAAGAVLLFANAPFEVVATLVTRVARHFGKRVTPRNVRHQQDDTRRLLG